MVISLGPKHASSSHHLVAHIEAEHQQETVRECQRGSWRYRGWDYGGRRCRARRITRALPQLCGSALFKRSSGACWLNAQQDERANTAQLHFYRMLCGKTPLTHTSAWQLGLSYGPGGSTSLSHDHCNDLKGQLLQQAEATPTSWTALWKMQFGSLHNM